MEIELPKGRKMKRELGLQGSVTNEKHNLYEKETYLK